MILGSRTKPPEDPYQAYKVVGITPTDRADLPWEVTIEGLGSLVSYFTLGTRPKVKERAEKACYRMNQQANWLRTIS